MPSGLHDLHSIGPCPSGLHRPAWSLLCWAMPLRPAKPVIHGLAADIHDLCWAAPSDLHSALPAHAPHACTGLHNLCRVTPLMAARACTISAGTVPLKPAKLAIHRHEWAPFRQPMPFRHARPTLQRPASVPQRKASAIGPCDPTHQPPATKGLQTCLRDTHRQVWMLKE
jgi:hypothetical protein